MTPPTPCPTRAPRVATALVLLATALASLPAAGGAVVQGQERTHAFVDVAVIPMDRERVLDGQTVVVRDGRIVALGPASEVSVPADAVRIDGSGRFLMPGLAEMHAHVPPVQGDAWPDRGALEDILFLYVANGVTTTRGMLGAPYQLALRDELERGRLLGPTLYVGAPSLNGNSAPDPAAAERLVRAHAAAGYDLQKIHPGVSRATWDRMVAVADEVGLTFGGHVPAAVGLEHALASGASTVDHLDGFVEASASGPVRARLLRGEQVPLGEVVAGASPERIRELARSARDTGAWVVPTMYLWENLYGASDPETILSQPEMRYVSARQRQGWRNQAGNRPSLPADVMEELHRLRREILLALSEAGAGVLMGTDSPQMFNVPGFALHRELRVMEETGMSRWRILESGTSAVARYASEELGREDDFGSVAVGKRADLVLLEANPLDHLANLTRRAGVMVRGRWIGAEEIDEGLARIAAKHAGATE